MDFTFFGAVGSVRHGGPQKKNPEKSKKKEKETNMTKMPRFLFFPIEKFRYWCWSESCEGINVLIKSVPECNK
jgi:hypothetical protein